MDNHGAMKEMHLTLIAACRRAQKELDGGGGLIQANTLIRGISLLAWACSGFDPANDPTLMSDAVPASDH
jgi:hypothetical protein